MNFHFFGCQCIQGAYLGQHIPFALVRRFDDANAVHAGHQFPPVCHHDKQEYGHNVRKPLAGSITSDVFRQPVEPFNNPFHEVLKPFGNFLHIAGG